MAIKKIRVINFKSFKEMEIKLGNFNVVIGANASGKSNFIQIFQFLRDIINIGLNNAISMQGGVEYLRNINIGASENLAIDLVNDKEIRWIAKKTKKGLIGTKTCEANYGFTIKFKKKGQKIEIVRDTLKLKCDLFSLDEKKRTEEEKIGEGEINISHVNGRVKAEIGAEMPIKEDDIIPPFLREKLASNTLLLENPYLFPPRLDEIFSEISIYDFDPKLPKKSAPITGKAELEEEGSNLSIVLKNIIEDKNKKRKLFNLISEVLPFVHDVDVEKFADKSLLFKLREKYFKKQYLPASLVSDGTINITLLIIALYFEKKLLTIIEEPERNIHPYLISKMVNMMKEASQEKQIIVTTHNPEIIRHAELENILLISRDKEGFSIISRPADSEEVKAFLKKEIGIEELFVQNLLEV